MGEYSRGYLRHSRSLEETPAQFSTQALRAEEALNPKPGQEKPQTVQLFKDHPRRALCAAINVRVTKSGHIGFRV